MITLKEAVKIATEFRGSKVSSGNECSDSWIFGFKEDEGKLGSAPVVVSKKSGECRFFDFTNEEIELLSNSSKLDKKDLKFI